ncbi:MAG: hypothetical protein ACUZ8H_00105, partial [Candidatus Anammoxibacter sp.]
TYLMSEAEELVGELIEIAKASSSGDSTGTISWELIPVWLEMDIYTFWDDMAELGGDDLKAAISKLRESLYGE